MNWTVTIQRRAAKRIARLPKPVRNSRLASIRAIEEAGPVRGDWPNHGKLADDRHRCHLKKGSPTDVAVWEVTNREIRLAEVTCAGTHEQAPY